MQLNEFIRNIPNNRARKKDDQPFTHLRRELVQAVLKLEFDNEFWEAYKNGIIVDCADGIRRRLYPRIFTYTADYPEKYVWKLKVLHVAELTMPHI